MQTGDIVIISFPFTDLISYKARPAVVIRQVSGKYQDVILSLISSVVPQILSPLQMLLKPDSTNNLRVLSVIKVERIATVENDKILSVIGKLSKEELAIFKQLFKSLVD
jgi:mRNA interferase MazF